MIWPTQEGIMDWLKTAPIPKLTPAEKKEPGSDGFKIEWANKSEARLMEFENPFN